MIVPASPARRPEMIRRVVLAIGLGAFALSLAACNTVKGAGKDIESVGQKGDDVIHNK
jgi:predicted small secreted protein